MGHNMVMKERDETTVKIAAFKARLSQHLKYVRRGHPLTLLVRDAPVARVLPYDPEQGRLVIRRPVRDVKTVRLPPPIRKRVDSLRALLQERRIER